MNRRVALLVIGVAVTAVSLYFALRGTDFAELGHSLRTARFELIPLFLLCLACFYWLKAIRWRLLLHIDGDAPATARLAGPMMIGFAANNVLPFRLGEIIRIVIGARRTQLPQTAILTSVVIERIFDVITLLLLTSLAALADSSAGMTHPIMPYVAAIAFAAMLGLLVVAFGSSYVFRLLDGIERRFGSRILRFVVSKAKTVEAGMQSIRSPLQLATILVNSVLQWLLLALAIQVACWAVDATISTSIAIYLMLLITIAISIPSTPGFFGIIEYSFVLALGAFGIDAERALAAAIYYHVITWVSVTMAGTIFLHRYSLAWSQLGKSDVSEKALGHGES